MNAILELPAVNVPLFVKLSANVRSKLLADVDNVPPLLMVSEPPTVVAAVRVTVCVLAMITESPFAELGTDP